MDGRNSTGRTVSLLNEAGPITLPPLPLNRHPRRTSAFRHRPRPLYSLPSTPTLSPQTSSIPPLSRSESSDSRLFPSPSPVTPNFIPFDSQDALQPGKTILTSVRQQVPRQSSSSSTITTSSLTPTSELPSPSNISVTSQGLSRHPYLTTPNSVTSSPNIESFPSASSEPSLDSQSRLRKNQFPCPLAKLYDCADYFTTSGHAARHAKKHTGKKDAFCPECNKAFTRKDNMEQHRRTHQSIKVPSTIISNRIKKPSASVKSITRHRSDRSDTGSEGHADYMDIEPSPGSPALSSPASSRHYHSSLNSPVDSRSLHSPASIGPPRSLHSPISTGAPRSLHSPSSTGPSSAPLEPTSHPFSTDPNPADRPPLHRSNVDTSLTNVAAFRALDSPTFAQPSPGLSHGLDALALVASDHRRLSEGSLAD